MFSTTNLLFDGDAEKVVEDFGLQNRQIIKENFLQTFDLHFFDEPPKLGQRDPLA